MPKTKNPAQAQALGRMIARIEAELAAVKREYQAMTDELAAAQQATAEAQEARAAAMTERDTALTRLAETERALEAERSVRRQAAARLRETCEFLAAGDDRADGTVDRGVNENDDGVTTEVTPPAAETGVVPMNLPPAIADACADLVTRGTAIDTTAALLQLAELGLKKLDQPMACEMPRADAHPEPTLPPG